MFPWAATIAYRKRKLKTCQKHGCNPRPFDQLSSDRNSLVLKRCRENERKACAQNLSGGMGLEDTKPTQNYEDKYTGFAIKVKRNQLWLIIV